MGKKGRKGGGSAKQADNDDALLDAAIKENVAAKQQAAAKKEEEEISAMAAEMSVRQLSKQDVVGKLDEIPTFCVMNEAADGKKKFVPMRFADSDGAPGPECCAFFIEPSEAKESLQQAAKAAPDMNLVIGCMPLGMAYALCAGWAEAQGSSTFILRTSRQLTQRMKPLMTRQLEQLGMEASSWHFPVFMCEELQSPTVLPVFLSHDGLAATWEATGKTGPPPSKLSCLDLRVVVAQMLKPFKETGSDWSIVRFLGTERAYNVVREGLDQLDGHKAQALANGDEPPPLEPHDAAQ
jgi:hypothetical protein